MQLFMLVSYNKHRLYDCTLHACMSNCESVPWIKHTLHFSSNSAEIILMISFTFCFSGDFSMQQCSKENKPMVWALRFFSSALHVNICGSHPKLFTAAWLQLKCFPPIWVDSDLGLVSWSSLLEVLILWKVLHWSFLICSDFALIQAYR